MTPNDHRAALFDALTLCERAWGKSLALPSSDAIQAHDAARDQHHAAVEAIVQALEQAHEQIERLSLDLHAARNELQRAWAQLEAIGAGGVDRRLHTGVAVPQEARSALAQNQGD